MECGFVGVGVRRIDVGVGRGGGGCVRVGVEDSVCAGVGAVGSGCSVGCCPADSIVWACSVLTIYISLPREERWRGPEGLVPPWVAFRFICCRSLSQYTHVLRLSSLLSLSLFL